MSRTSPDTLAETLSDAGLATAPRRGDREVRACDVLLQRRRGGGVGGRGRDPRAVAARRRELRPEAGDVRAGGGRRVVDALGEGYGFCVVNFANPDMVGHTGVIPAVVAAVETADACLGRRRRGSRSRRRRLPRHRRPRQRREDARGRRREPAHGAHDEPGAARRDRARRELRDGGELVRSRADGASTCSGSSSPRR